MKNMKIIIRKKISNHPINEEIEREVVIRRKDEAALYFS